MLSASFRYLGVCSDEFVFSSSASALQPSSPMLLSVRSAYVASLLNNNVLLLDDGRGVPDAGDARSVIRTRRESMKEEMGDYANRGFECEVKGVAQGVYALC